MSLHSRESVSHNNGKKASRLVHLPAVLRRQFADLVRIAFFLRSERRFLLPAEAHFHFPTLSSALSNTETIVSTSQETRRKLGEDAAIEKRSRSTEVNGAVRGRAREKARFAAALPGNDAEPPRNWSIRTYLIGMYNI